MLAEAWTPHEIIDCVWKYRTGSSYFSPGEPGQWHYSNTDYILLGLVIEKVPGKSFSANLWERILDPLEMKSSVLLQDVPPPGSVSGNLAPPFDIETTRWNLSQGWRAGGVTSTPLDMSLFIRALMYKHLFTNPDTLELMNSTVFAPPFNADYGLGLIVFGSGIWGNIGQTPGFESVIAYRESDDFVVVAWTNCSTSGVNLLARQATNLH
jgi:D-alanyl-D-alanine carboxypeptidase